jgi:hypothetical protein
MIVVAILVSLVVGFFSGVIISGIGVYSFLLKTFGREGTQSLLTQWKKMQEANE